MVVTNHLNAQTCKTKSIPCGRHHNLKPALTSSHWYTHPPWLWYIQVPTTSCLRVLQKGLQSVRQPRNLELSVLPLQCPELRLTGPSG